MNAALSALVRAALHERGWRGENPTRCPCPIHKNHDEHPSLSVNELRSGELVIRCFAGGDFEQILGALGIGSSTNPAPDRTPRARPQQAKSEAPRDFAPILREGTKRADRDLSAWGTRLGVLAESLLRFQCFELERAALREHGFGFGEGAYPDCALVWPEFGQEGLCGLVARTIDGRKGSATRSKRGITRSLVAPNAFRPLFCTEGSSDAWSLDSIGVQAISRPNNELRNDRVTNALEAMFREHRGPIHFFLDAVAGDASIPLALELERRLGRRITRSRPPANADDCRKWLAARVAAGLDLGDSAARAEACEAIESTIGARTGPVNSPAVGSQSNEAILHPGTDIGSKITKGRFMMDAEVVTASSTDWLWNPVLPLGEITLLAGHPDVGKSVLCLEIAARITRGEPMPLSAAPTLPASVLLVSAEDDPSKTIMPRFLAAGGIPTRLKIATDEALELGNIATIMDAVEPDIPADLRLIIVDTLTSLADRIDLNDNGDVRGLYRRLKVFAARHRCAFLVIAHFSKQEGRSPLARIAGSVAVGSTPRSAWVALHDPDDKNRIMLLRAKGNLTKTACAGYGFSIASAHLDAIDGTVPRIEWEAKPETRTAAEILRAIERPAHDGEAPNSAERWLGQLLPPGRSLPSADVQAARTQAGIGYHALFAAARRLGVETRDRQGRNSGPFHWTRPAPAAPSGTVATTPSVHILSEGVGNAPDGAENRQTDDINGVPSVPDTVLEKEGSRQPPSGPSGTVATTLSMHILSEGVGNLPDGAENRQTDDANGAPSVPDTFLEKEGSRQPPSGPARTVATTTMDRPSGAPSHEPNRHVPHAAVARSSSGATEPVPLPATPPLEGTPLQRLRGAIGSPSALVIREDAPEVDFSEDDA